MTSSEPTQQAFAFAASSIFLSPGEVYERLDQAMIRAVEEDRRIERKSSGIHVRELATYFSMWANTAPDGGVIVVGVDDKTGDCHGLSSLPQKRLNELEKAGIELCPDARHQTKRVKVINPSGHDDFVLAIRVQYRSDKVVETHDGSVYTRVGDSRRKLGRDEVRELENDKGQVDLEQEPSRTPYPSGFDRQAVTEFAETIRVAAGFNETHSDEEVLALRRLGKRSGGKFVPNVACALLFAVDPLSEFAGCKLRFLRYDGESEHTGVSFNAVKDQTIEGNIPTIIVMTERVLESQLRAFSRLGADGKFYTTSEYPKEAWYEAIVNACVHRSYGTLRNMPIFVKMFDDKLVIESPGGFPPFVTPQNIYEQHHPRNPHLMAALQYLRFVKCANEGTRRMRDTMAEQKLPSPEFVQKDAGHTVVRVTLRNDIKQRRVWVDSDASKIIGEAKSKGLSQDAHRAINFVAEHQRINVSQLQRLTGRSWPSARTLLKKLVRDQIFQHIHKPGPERDPNAYYVLWLPDKND